MYFKKSEIYYTIWLHIILLLKKLLVMNMLVFNFHKETNVHKGYAYQFSDFITYKNTRINVRVVCQYYVFKESNNLLQNANSLLCSSFCKP
jgi:hypothetical protein